MDLHRFFVNSSDIEGNSIVVSGEEFHHMTVVLRHKVGYKVIISCDTDLDYYCTISAIDKQNVRLRVDKIAKNDTETAKNVTLYVAISKADKIELICQKAVELGVKKIIPFVSNNSEKSTRMDRLSKIMVDASKQCQRSKRAELCEIATFDEMQNAIKSNDVTIFCYENEMESSLKNFRVNLINSNNIALIVGSEGGFTDDEAEEIISSGALSITLGKRILRTETAVISAISLIMYELGEMN